MNLYADETLYRDYIISPDSHWKWTYTHINYDGPEDARTGTASTFEMAKDCIDEQILRIEDDPKSASREIDYENVYSADEFANRMHEYQKLK